MGINVLEQRVLGMLRRYRWSLFKRLSMAKLVQGSGGEFREVTIALINLEQEAYIRWPDKSSLHHIVLRRKAYGRRAFGFPVISDHKLSDRRTAQHK
ncbi:hypothetical protein QWJ34_23885 [Saccharibacillus sp. CPCC 101409]|uniref:hypothetical protein n=1 Tax=Saccharibacillus sp. CPCC 101409 TaxID=3058041 RepID=UPI002670F029|nr:hypothetical protein [Saccharibacillus sp. CPCC 101409]MDO3412828.1 hypothetical protein [Saccharibacillus sp. CPCC 101409]